MAQSPKTAWQKTPEGTTDWESVFETPETGFIALVSQVPSIEALKLAATVVIEKLFTRKADTAERTKLIGQLDDIIAKSGDDFAAAVEATARLLRTIKDTRIEKARAYIERKKAGAAIDRRTGLLWKIDFLLKPAVLFPVGGLFIAALAALMFLVLQSTFGPTKDITPQRPEGVVERSIPLETVPPEDTAPPKVAPPVALIPVLLKTFRWPLLAQGGTGQPQYYAVVLYIREREESRLICRRLPKVLDTIYQSFNTVMPISSAVQKEELNQLQGSVRRAINALLPTSVIMSVEVARYGEKGFRVANLPPFCNLPKRPPEEKPAKDKEE